MDYEKLIEQLKNLEACAYGYHINGEVLGMDCSDFEQVMVDAATAISTLQAENEKMRGELEQARKDCAVAEKNHADCIAELERMKRTLAMMWFAYVNSDKEDPHNYETEALEEAERLLGPWKECMPKYLRHGPQDTLSKTDKAETKFVEYGSEEE